MTMDSDAAVQREASKVAALISAGDTTAIGNKLAEEYLEFTKNGKDFRDFLKVVKEKNTNDLKATANLPALEYTSSPSGNLRVSITTPGHYLGNLWRDSEEVFAAIKNGKQNFGGAPAVGWPGATHEVAIAEGTSAVDAYGDSRVIAKDGSVVHSYMHSKVTAQPGSYVRAYNDSEVTAQGGASVYAEDHAHVKALAGSCIFATENASVIAERGSAIEAHDHASVVLYDHLEANAINTFTGAQVSNLDTLYSMRADQSDEPELTDGTVTQGGLVDTLQGRPSSQDFLDAVLQNYGGR